ncbi:GreA/GreB family elongation factor [Chitinophaga sp. MM2321]|uniref:GreA/GreB family elongation factor n=1 Tax=Chitinophaga sp. MM2321 TaxID=3137178 RepID=UPI0032D58D6D
MTTENNEQLLMLKEDHDILTQYLKSNSPKLMYDQHLQKEHLEKMSKANVLSNDDFPNTASRLYSTVIIRDTITRTNLEYKLVPPNETDEWNGNISALTPFGLALMGLKKGESFVWQLSKKKKFYSVVEVRNSTFV